MSVSFLFLLPLLLLLAPLIVETTGLSISDAFDRWTDRFNKTYSNEEERNFRRAVWMEHHALIEAHNEQEPSPMFQKGHNHFSDRTMDEIHKFFGLGKYHHSTTTRHEKKKQQQQQEKTALKRYKRWLRSVIPSNNNRNKSKDNTGDKNELPNSINWVEKGAVTYVKNQWFCGSCWAFSGVGALEGAHAIATGDLVSLSVQQILDCDLLAGGCGGSMPEDVYAYDNATMGLCSDREFPYGARRHKDPVEFCRKQKAKCTPVPHTGVAGSVEIEEATNDALMEGITIQPVSVTIQAMEHDFLFYKSGVFNGKCGNNNDHAVLAVGYGTTDDGDDYWLVKNSWGTHWGEKGYVRMSRELEDKGGMCGILLEGNRPILAER